ncbi:hypothetical protein N864_03200 [Intrasporangium chromatireducens Q5-1]|uniref:Fis family transcriptional regulator n=1 Tax=Intrasporangium chromatireducens Q5-1 TaxID=584657 RepID=W9GHI6_9MICO|nr:hypothetical protein [Intrasporangium chromatireducens]EWT05515.1 hypothetical protein N864_03200 [Intrasporangium chromatireducens Q5-1]
MRWDQLFEDLDAQLQAEGLRERDAEVADRTRHERAQIDVQARLLASVGAAPVAVHLPSGSLRGVIRDVGPDWVLVEGGPGASSLVVTAAIRAVTGMAPGAVVPSIVARRFGLGAALRGISRDRSVVELIAGRLRLVGTLDVVGSDHVEMAEHAPDVPRRARNVVALHVVPFSALEVVQRLRR